MNINSFNECLKYKLKNISNDPIFFYHVPKSGGTTFCDLLANLFKKSLRINGTLFKNNDKGGSTAFENFINNKNNFLEIFNKADFVYGHLPFEIQSYLPEKFSTFTIIREPLERAISHYLWAIERNYINKGENLEDLFDKNQLPSNPLFNQFALNYNNIQIKSIDIEIAIQNIKKINYLCKIEDIFLLIKFIISKYNKYNVLFQNRQINLNKKKITEEQVKIIKKNNLIDIQIYNRLLKENFFYKFTEETEPIKDDYIFFSRKGSALIDNKNIQLINKTKISKVKKDLISTGFKIITY